MTEGQVERVASALREVLEAQALSRSRGGT
jgi:hypothetical protein